MILRSCVGTGAFGPRPRVDGRRQGELSIGGCAQAGRCWKRQAQADRYRRGTNDVLGVILSLASLWRVFLWARYLIQASGESCHRVVLALVAIRRRQKAKGRGSGSRRDTRRPDLPGWPEPRCHCRRYQAESARQVVSLPWLPGFQRTGGRWSLRRLRASFLLVDPGRFGRRRPLYVSRVMAIYEPFCLLFSLRNTVGKLPGWCKDGCSG
jgi:hypothetical protein